MHVLVNALSARLGGGQTYLRNVLLNAPPRGRIHVLSPDNFDLDGMPANVERVRLGIDLSNPYRRAVWEHMHLPPLAYRLGVQTLFCPGGLLPRRRLMGGIRTAVTFQNMLPYDRDQRRRYPWGARRLRMALLEDALTSAMRRADVVIFLSRFAADFISARLGPLRGRAAIIPHGIDTRFFADLDKPLPRPDFLSSGDYYLYVSYLDFYKSQVEVVRAFGALRERGEAPGKLVLAGSGYSPYRKAVRAEITRLGLGSAVLLTGHLPHELLPALYQHAQLSIFASRTENCPNILMEMMASGRPALVSSMGPMPELAGDTVSYFDPRDAGSLVLAWSGLLVGLAAAEERARHARQRIVARGWDVVARETWDTICAT